MQLKLIKNTLLTSIVLSFSACAFLPSSQPSVYYPNNDFRSFDTGDPNLRGTMKPYVIAGKKYFPTVVEVGETAEGTASWYGPGFHGKLTSNGETYDQNSFTAAHKTLPMNTMLKVRNIENNKEIIVRVNDRGPFVAGRIIDLSNAAAHAIDMVAKGTAHVKLEVIAFGKVDESTLAKTNEKIIKNNKTIKSQELKEANEKEVFSFGEEVSTKQEKPLQKTYTGGAFMVQIGSFKNESGAMRFSKRYKRYKDYVSVIKTGNDGLHRVFLTGFRSMQEARDFIAKGAFKGAFAVRM